MSEEMIESFEEEQDGISGESGLSEGRKALSKVRQHIAERILQNLEKSNSIWTRGWKTSGPPVSAITGKRYRGINNIQLMLAAMDEGYSDNRWLTYRQMDDHGWHFKTDEEGKSLGKNKGVLIEYYELRDRATKEPFDKAVLSEMDDTERKEYVKENVYPIRKSYIVFNGDLVDGLPAIEKNDIDESTRSDRAERFLQHWSDTEAKIVYGGSRAFYSPQEDMIRLPKRENFKSAEEFYATGLHEAGHSTGHAKRLNRQMDGEFGSAAYAEEELRAEIASMFLEQEFGIPVSEKHFENNSAYIKSWHDKIKSDPSVLMKAITDADKITKYMLSKEQPYEEKKEVEPYAVVESMDGNHKPVYKLYMIAEHGQTRAFTTSFHSRDELQQELDKLQTLPFWKGKEFREVSPEELQTESIRQAEAAESSSRQAEMPEGEEEKTSSPAETTVKAHEEEETQETEKTQEVKEEPITVQPIVPEQSKEEETASDEEKQSEVYIRPSEARERQREGSIPVDMSLRGVDSLQNMEDRALVERATKAKSGEKFDQLYHGLSLLGDEEKDERSLLTRLAVFTEDNEQIMRVFKSSGQYRAEKPNAHYEKLMREAVGFVARKRAERRSQTPTSAKGRFANAK